MELPSQEGEMPIPLNSSYGGGVHIIHHDNTNNNNNNNNPQTLPSNGPIIPSTVVLHDPQHEHQVVVSSNFNKKTFKYRECLKNHAASMGGNATDGCGEFMPSGEEGTIEALTCSACNCHRNFHRKEIEGEVSQIVPTPYDTFYHHHHHNVNSRIGRKIFVGHHHNNNNSNKSGGGYNMGGEYHHPHHRGVGVGVVPPSHQMIMSYNVGPVLPNSDDQSDEQEEGNMVIRPPHLVKKRFRTKFTQEQKEKMLNFAERVGWKIQKQEEGVVQQFCAEVGVKRRVLKVWMHNNKHSLGKKNNLNNNNDIISQHMMTNVVEGNQD